MFWRLGFISAWRNLERSILALLSMALAAGFMANAISLSRGYAQMNRVGYRSLIGGDISAYSLDLSAAVGQDDAVWQFQTLLDVGDTDLAVMMPELLQSGFISSSARTPFDERLIEAIAAQPSVRAVYPRYQLPALANSKVGAWFAPLRGRDLVVDALAVKPLSEYISSGRWFVPEDEGKPVAVIMDQQRLPAGQRQLGVGDLLQLTVPKVIQRDGRSYYDYTEPLLTELRIIGVLSIPTREVSYDLVRPDEGLILYEDYRTQIVMQSGEIHLPLATWWSIWQTVGGAEYQPQQLGLMVDDLSYLEDIVISLRQIFPERSFYSVSQLIDRIEGGFALENPEKLAIDPLMLDALPPIIVEEQTVLALDLRMPMMVLIFINAALIVAANLLIMVSERKVEIGILKAVGSTRFDVVQMVLSEALLISILGALAGFGFMRLPAVFNQLTNGVAMSVLARGVLLGLVLGAACIAAVVFGMLPALMMANLSVREVLQTE